MDRYNFLGKQKFETFLPNHINFQYPECGVFQSQKMNIKIAQNGLFLTSRHIYAGCSCL